MDKTDILALVGAAAWIPQILYWIFAAMKRPKVKLISLGTVQIGYEFSGPVIAITSSISAKQKDALVTKMTLKAIHEKGEERLFTWVWLNETALKMRIATGETAEFTKNQPAIALQVSTLTPAEKLVVFRDMEYAEKYEELVLAIVDHHTFLKKSEKDHIEVLLRSKELAKFRDWYLSNMYWKEGLYTFEVNLFEAYGKSVHLEKFSVRLDKGEIEALKKNCDLFEKGLREFASKHDSQNEEEKDQLKYIYPKIKALS